MKVTNAHLTYWRERQDKPAWAKLIKVKKFRWTKEYKVTVNDLINKAADINNNTPSIMTANNLMAICKLNTSDLRAKLLRCARYPNTVINPLKRSAYAAKWLRRIRKNDVK